MKVPSTSKLRNSFVAVSFAAVLALTGCSDDEAAQSGASDGGGAQPAASDGGGAQQAAPEADVSDVPDVVAEVNGEKVTKEDFVPAYEAQFQQAAMQQQQTGQETDQAAMKKQVAEQLVNNELLQQGAADAGIKATDKDIDATLEEIAAQNGMKSSDEVIKALEQQGMKEKDVRADAASQFALTAYVEQESDIKEPTDEELKAQYDQLVEQQSQAGGQQSEVPPFEEVKEQLAQQTVSQQQGEAATELAADLREKGDVTINL